MPERKSSVADPESGSGACLTPCIRDPGSAMGKKSGSGIGIRDEQTGSYFRELRNQFLRLKYLNSLMRIRDPWWKTFGSRMDKIRIRDLGITKWIRNTSKKAGLWPEVLELALWWVSGTTGVSSHHVVLLVTWNVVRGIAARWLVLLVFLRLQGR